MNPEIIERFDVIELRLLRSSVIAAYEIVNQVVGKRDGKLRIRATLWNSDLIEIYEYVQILHNQVVLTRYSFHWQDAAGNLIRRWDNAPHHVYLGGTSHHLHNADGTVSDVSEPPDAFFFVEYLDRTMP